MTIRPFILGLAATALSLPAFADIVPPAGAGLGLAQLAVSPTFSVRSTQDVLNRLGYDAGPVDGIMGNRTRGAIMAYQRDNNLAVTGEANSSLYAHMLTTGGARVGATAGAGTTTGTAAQTSAETVIDVQADLRRRGYDIPSISGRYDAETRSAVVAYQQDAGLSMTGVIDETLLASLRASNTTRSQYGEQRGLVRDVQLALNSRGYGTGTADGVLSQQTQAAIRTYQADNGLPITGTVSPSLLARLQTGATVSTGASERATVTAVQEELIARGYLKGKADGVMGAATSAAIREFEQDAGMPVTGSASVTFLSALRASGVTRSAANRLRTVAEIEEALAVKGYPVGPADGQMDARTEAAIRAFQQDARLPVDGKASTKLLATIRASTVTAGPLTPEQAVQGIIQGTTTRLLESLGTTGTQRQ